MAEETLAFYVILTPVMIAAGYDALTAVAVILLGAGIGVLGSTVNAFSTVIASDAAGVPFTDGLMLRLVILGADLRGHRGLCHALCRTGEGRSLPLAGLRQEGRERGAFPQLRRGHGRFHRIAQDRPAAVRRDLRRDDLGRVAGRLVDGRDERAVPVRRHRHRRGRASGRKGSGRGFRRRRARPAGRGADHRAGARHRRHHGRGPHDRHRPALGRRHRRGPEPRSSSST